VAKNSYAESGRESVFPSREPEMIVVFIPTTQDLQPFGNRASSSWHPENSDCSSRPLRISLRKHALRLPRRSRYSYKPLRGSSKLFHPTSPAYESDITGLPACRSCASLRLFETFPHYLTSSETTGQALDKPFPRNASANYQNLPNLYLSATRPPENKIRTIYYPSCIYIMGGSVAMVRGRFWIVGRGSADKTEASQLMI
jgi:hypothetical protein